MVQNPLHQISELVKILSEPLIANKQLKENLEKIKQKNNKQKEILKYYQNSLEKCRKSYSYEQGNYESQLLNTRTLAENYEKQLKLVTEEKNEITYNREQIELIYKEISILKDKLQLLNKNKNIRKNIKSSSTISSLKHQAFKLQEKLKSCKFTK